MSKDRRVTEEDRIRIKAALDLEKHRSVSLEHIYQFIAPKQKRQEVSW